MDYIYSSQPVTDTHTGVHAHMHRHTQNKTPTSKPDQSAYYRRRRCRRGLARAARGGPVSLRPAEGPSIARGPPSTRPRPPPHPPPLAQPPSHPPPLPSPGVPAGPARRVLAGRRPRAARRRVAESRGGRGAIAAGPVRRARAWQCLSGPPVDPPAGARQEVMNREVAIVVVSAGHASPWSWRGRPGQACHSAWG